ncbi:hypothetical protein B0H14DRAFT_2576192 [Mycena olivaceomarginata]|nr:hypothetical protein B0H14DRAFT_2576192 [Mycena olivaceomarginata]
MWGLMLEQTIPTPRRILVLDHHPLTPSFAPLGLPRTEGDLGPSRPESLFLTSVAPPRARLCCLHQGAMRSPGQRYLCDSGAFLSSVPVSLVGNEPFGTLAGIFSDWSATGLGSTYPLSNEPFGTVPGNYYDWNTITFGTGSRGMVQSTGTRVAWRIYIGDSFLWKAPSLAHVGPQWGDVQKLPIEAWLGQLPSDDPNESEDEAHIIIEPR